MEDLDREGPPWGLDFDDFTCGSPNKRAPDRRAYRDPPIADVGLDQSDEFVFGDLAPCQIAHTHRTPNFGMTVGCPSDYFGPGDLTLENCDPSLKLGLFFEQFEKSRVDCKRAVFPRLAQTLAHLASAVRTQRRQLGAELLISVGCHHQSLFTIRSHRVHLVLLLSGSGPRPPPLDDRGGEPVKPRWGSESISRAFSPHPKAGWRNGVITRWRRPVWEARVG
jgi:hypothetical protein